MMAISAFLHEEIYRSTATMKQLRDFNLILCGAGALGGNLADNLARTGCTKLRIIDRDRVEEHNISTQPYQRTDIGAFKSRILANMLYRALGITADAYTDDLKRSNIHKLLGNVNAKNSLIIDMFDNSVARGDVTEYCIKNDLPCLHVGLASDYAEIIWNERYRVPSAAQDDVCEYPLARNLIMITVAVACETIINYIATGTRKNFTITLADFAIREL